jgi:hypothetical protein
VNTGILNLVDIPHFGKVKEVNNCIKQLMVVFHGSFLWMVEPISIDVELIVFITVLSSMGESPMKYLDEKTKDKYITKEMNKTYDIERGLCRIIIKRIIDATTRITKAIMDYKLLRKCRKEEFPVGVVVAATQSTNRTMLNWVPYLLNLFLNDCKDV